MYKRQSPAGATLAPAHDRALNPSEGEPSRTTTPVLASRCVAAKAMSTLSARAAAQVRMTAPWLTMATVPTPLAAASATTASNRPSTSSPFSPPGIRSAVSPAAQENAVRMYSSPSAVSPGSISRSPAEISRMPSRTSGSSPRAAASGAAVSWVRRRVETYRASMSSPARASGSAAAWASPSSVRPGPGTAVSSR